MVQPLGIVDHPILLAINKYIFILLISLSNKFWRVESTPISTPGSPAGIISSPVKVLTVKLDLINNSLVKISIRVLKVGTISVPLNNGL